MESYFEKRIIPKGRWPNMRTPWKWTNEETNMLTMNYANGGDRKNLLDHYMEEKPKDGEKEISIRLQKSEFQETKDKLLISAVKCATEKMGSQDLTKLEWKPERRVRYRKTTSDGWQDLVIEKDDILHWKNPEFQILFNEYLVKHEKKRDRRRR